MTAKLNIDNLLTLSLTAKSEEVIQSIRASENMNIKRLINTALYYYV